MQEIKVYVSAENSVGTLRDYANAKSQSAPPLVRDVDVVLKLRLFAANGSIEPYPIAQLQSVRAWKFVMDRDYDDKTQCIFQADDESITVAEVTDTVDETEYTYTEVSVPISKTNTAELAAWLGTSKQQTGLSAELAGYDEFGNTVFVLQLEGFSVRNRLTATGAPTELESDYWTEAQVRAFVSGQLPGIVDSEVDRIIPKINEVGNWVVDGVDTGLPSRGKQGEKGKPGAVFTPSVDADGNMSWTNDGDLENPATMNIRGPQGKRGEAFKIDASGLLSERSQYDNAAKNFAFLATDDGNVYIKQSDSSGDWSEPIPFKGDPGYTPVRGTDYWTEEDIAEIKSYVDEAILNGEW